MMFRVTHVLLTIGGMLACPFMCMATVSAHGAAAEQRAACSCCQHASQGPVGESNPEDKPVEPERRGEAPGEACDCACLCKGVVHTENDPQLVLNEQTASVVCLDFTCIVQADAGTQSVPSFAEAPPPPKLGSGRSIRLAIASLLL